MLLRKELWVFYTKMLRNFISCSSCHAECKNLLSLGSSLGSSPQVTIRLCIPNRCAQHKCFCSVFRLRQPFRFHNLIKTVYALAKFLNILVFVQKLSNLRIPRKMDMAHIIQSHNSGQRSRTLYGQPIIKHLDLDIRPLDAVISMLF